MVVAAMAVGAGVTYAVTRGSTPPSAPSISQPTAPPTPQINAAAEQARAKQRVCDVFNASARGQDRQGGIADHGELNVPVALRTLGSVTAVQNVLEPATPAEVTAAAHRYINTSLDLVTVALQPGPSIDEVNRLTHVANDATFAFADVCGLGH